MKNLLLATAFLLMPNLVFAQNNPQPPAAWTEYLQQETAKKQAFYQQIKADRDAFLNSHPEVQTYLQQLHAASKARLQAWLLAHPSTTTHATTI